MIKHMRLQNDGQPCIALPLFCALSFARIGVGRRVAGRQHPEANYQTKLKRSQESESRTHRVYIVCFHGCDGCHARMGVCNA